MLTYLVAYLDAYLLSYSTAQDCMRREAKIN